MKPTRQEVLQIVRDYGYRPAEDITEEGLRAFAQLVKDSIDARVRAQAKTPWKANAGLAAMKPKRRVLTAYLKESSK